ncbi:bifunctional 5,10-methylenetetrahydrofolate dehydrogenase/5,10-methenyltetrahydrofolate cyclohydrolase [Candidatus Gracilibacteria bacterium]|nr:bifunctional 5,10-methylenetetrahydrofolate dehydrogenase/5,10-methenyltetrahydrofolate cyclohydrolase [Candidatus Gracilibacteria bacterium]MCF7819663.1 bifunctional 5,10-methylenetetrahydrofolate dehydrogenase/5,10-methenyltetrahydrofolate cyclohydrolase [Candidatus Gracilibacteria bacterium]
MTAQIISGRDIAQKIIQKELIPRVRMLNKKSVQPKLVVIFLGENSASASYIRQKEKFAAQAGVASEVLKFPESISEEELLVEIKKINADDSIHGVIVQLPLPDHINVDKVISTIDPTKDVDGFSDENNSDLDIRKSLLPPCTPKGIITMLEKSGVNVAEKRVVVMGRSRIVGRPVAEMMLFRGAMVKVLHSKTPPQEAAQALKEAEVLVVAVGKPELVRGEQLSRGVIVIDVGIHRREDGSLCGDVHFESTKKVASLISPVPGGVGPMTVVSLIENTITAAEQTAN